MLLVGGRDLTLLAAHEYSRLRYSLKRAQLIRVAYENGSLFTPVGHFVVDDIDKSGIPLHQSPDDLRNLDPERSRNRPLQFSSYTSRAADKLEMTLIG